MGISIAKRQPDFSRTVNGIFAPACELYTREICAALKINGDPLSVENVTLLKAIAIHESHMDPLSFRFEEAHARRNAGWTGRAWRKVRTHNPSWQTNMGRIEFRQFHSSFGLMHVFTPALAEWYPADTTHRNTPAEMSAKEVIENPARLLDPTTNFLWGMRLLKLNHQRAQPHTRNRSLSKVEQMAVTFNGGAGALASHPPAVSSVPCKKGVDPNCSHEGERRLPYHESVRNLVNSLNTTCRQGRNICGGRP
jgi:hypothetical protein